MNSTTTRVTIITAGLFCVSLIALAIHHSDNSKPGISSSVVATVTKPALVASSTRPLTVTHKLAPFREVVWYGEKPHVLVSGHESHYELLSINGVSTSEIISYCKAFDPANWRKRFDEDVVEILSIYGHHLGSKATFELIRDTTGERVTFQDFPVSRPNWLSTVSNEAQLTDEQANAAAAATRNSPPPKPSIKFTLADIGYQRATTFPYADCVMLSPFVQTTWDNRERVSVSLADAPRVPVSLGAVDGVGITQIISYCKAIDKDHWQQLLTENLVGVLEQNGHHVGSTVTLEVWKAGSQEATTLNNVAVTKHNWDENLEQEQLRQAIMYKMTMEQQD